MNKRLSVEEFITIHEQAESLEEAMAKAKISRSAYEARAHYLRDALKLPLKKFKRRTLKDRVPELLELIKKVRSEK